VIVLTDKAHRSQYDTLALNMRAALPNALFLAFAGTPLIVGEERTREVFGDYVSIYDFQQSVEDGATVPLFYENRTPELQLTNPTLNEDIYDIVEAAGLDEAQEVDYANVFASLEKALAIYGAGKEGKSPVRDKKKLVEDLKKAVDEATEFCANNGVVLPAIEQLPLGDIRRLERIADAVNALISPDPLRKEFLGHERIVKTLYDAVKPDPVALEFAPRVSCICSIADAIRAQINPGSVDISGVMGEVNKLLDASIEGVRMTEKPAPVMDLSKIDFGALGARFKESKRKNIELESLKAAIRAMLERLIRLNRTRMDFAERFAELIDDYNAGSKNIEQLFNELLALSRALTQEQTRHVRKNLSEGELTIFDILTRPGPELSSEEREEVKRVARHLLERLTAILTFNWRQTTQARARVRLAIDDALDTGLPRAYTPDLYQQKCSAVFEHVYETRQGAA
jgi:type I restriction enzyme, R subunit